MARREIDRGTRKLLMVAGAAAGAAIGRMKSSEGNRPQGAVAGAIVGAAAAYLVAPMVEQQLEGFGAGNIKGLLTDGSDDE